MYYNYTCRKSCATSISNSNSPVNSDEICDINIVFGDESGISVTFHFWKEQNMTSKCNLLHADNVLW